MKFREIFAFSATKYDFMHRLGIDVQLHPFFTSALNKGASSVPQPGRCLLGQTRCPLRRWPVGTHVQFKAYGEEKIFVVDYITDVQI
jgi:hypothetical protein